MGKGKSSGVGSWYCNGKKGNKEARRVAIWIKEKSVTDIIDKGIKSLNWLEVKESRNKGRNKMYRSQEKRTERLKGGAT